MKRGRCVQCNRRLGSRAVLLYRRSDGSQVFLCSRNFERRRCTYCGTACERLCDFPVLKVQRGREREATCDAPLCDRCATRIPGLEDRDLCRAHVPLWDFEKNVPKVGPGAPVAKE